MKPTSSSNSSCFLTLFQLGKATFNHCDSISWKKPSADRVKVLGLGDQGWQRKNKIC